MNYYQTPSVPYRVLGGPVLPFVGGLLVGGLFAPNKGPFYPSSPQPVPIYYNPVPYYVEPPYQSNNPTYNYQPIYTNGMPYQNTYNPNVQEQMLNPYYPSVSK